MANTDGNFEKWHGVAAPITGEKARRHAEAWAEWRRTRDRQVLIDAGVYRPADETG